MSQNPDWNQQEYFYSDVKIETGGFNFEVQHLINPIENLIKVCFDNNIDKNKYLIIPIGRISFKEYRKYLVE